MNSVEPIPTGENPPINERLWQAWVSKNRTLDKAGAANRLRLLQGVLGVAVLAAVLQTWMK